MKPNILILHADQHRQDCIGAYGNPDIRTPHIDMLAADGVRYTNHFCSYPVCTPSRYSFLSGLPVHRHGGWNNRCTLAPGIPTFASVLRAQGWRTAAVGKMHFTPTYLDVGFDRMLLAEQCGDGRFEDDYHQYLRAQGLADEIDLIDQCNEYRAQASRDYYDSFGTKPSPLPPAHHSTGWITRTALRELQSWDPDGGNLLMVGWIKPHHPFDPPAPYDTLYDPAKLTLLPGYTAEVPKTDAAKGRGFFPHEALTELRLREVMAKYYGCITQIDDGVGELTAHLKANGLYDNTLILYTSDHGDYLGYHHLLLKNAHLYDPLMKLPLVIKYPGGEKTGVCGALSTNAEAAAVLLTAAGAPAPDGMSRYGLENPGREMVTGEMLAGYQGRRTVDYMVRSERYKLLTCGSLERLLLFDLEQDPLELCNRAEDPAYAEVRRAHLEHLIGTRLFEAPVPYLDEHAPTLPGKSPGELAALQQGLRSYYDGKLRENQTGWL